MRRRMHAALDQASDRRNAAVRFAEQEGFNVTWESLHAARVAIERRARMDDEDFDEISRSRDPNDSNPSPDGALELDPALTNDLLRG